MFDENPQVPDLNREYIYTTIEAYTSRAVEITSLFAAKHKRVKFKQTMSKHVNFQSLQFVNKGTHIDLDVNGFKSVDRIDVTVRKTIEKFGASFDVKCDGWIEGGIKSTDINSHLYFGEGPIVGIRNSNVNFGDLHLDFHMNGICSVANGMISKSFVSTKAQRCCLRSFRTHNWVRWKDAISNKINGIPKIKSILSYCGKVMDVVNASNKDNDEEKEEEHTSPEESTTSDQEEHTSTEESTTSDQEEQRHSEQETKHFVSEMQSRAAELEDSVESASTKGSLNRNQRRHGISNKPKEIAESNTGCNEA